MNAQFQFCLFDVLFELMVIGGGVSVRTMHHPVHPVGATRIFMRVMKRWQHQDAGYGGNAWNIGRIASGLLVRQSLRVSGLCCQILRIRGLARLAFDVNLTLQFFDLAGQLLRRLRLGPQRSILCGRGCLALRQPIHGSPCV